MIPFAGLEGVMLQYMFVAFIVPFSFLVVRAILKEIAKEWREL